jgi:hypothetical protein
MKVENPKTISIATNNRGGLKSVLFFLEDCPVYCCRFWSDLLGNLLKKIASKGAWGMEDSPTEQSECGGSSTGKGVVFYLSIGVL